MRDDGTTDKAGERSAALISNVAQRFEFVRRLVCLILLRESLCGKFYRHASEAGRDEV